MPVKTVDLDALLDDPLELIIGGTTYRIETLTVEFAIRLSNATSTPSDEGPLALLLEVLTPLGVEPDVIKTMDARKALAAAFLVMSHFSTLPEKVLALGPTPAAARAAQDLLTSRGLSP